MHPLCMLLLVEWLMSSTRFPQATRALAPSSWHSQKSAQALRHTSTAKPHLRRWSPEAQSLLSGTRMCPAHIGEGHGQTGWALAQGCCSPLGLQALQACSTSRRARAEKPAAHCSPPHTAMPGSINQPAYELEKTRLCAQRPSPAWSHLLGQAPTSSLLLSFAAKSWMSAAWTSASSPIPERSSFWATCSEV